MAHDWQDAVQAIFNAASECVMLLDRGGRVISMNPSGLGLVGVGFLDEVQSIYSILPPEHHDAFSEFNSRVCSGEKGVLQFEILEKNGIRRWMEAHAVPYQSEKGGETLQLAFARDMTEQRRAAVELKAAEERWRFALEGAGDGVWDYDFRTGVNVASKRLKEILGFGPEEQDRYLNDWADRLHPESLGNTVDALRAVAENETDHYVIEQQVRCQDGSYKWLHTRGMVVSRSETGKPLRMIGTSADITKRKEIEARLQLAASVFSHAREGIIITDPEGTIVEVNDAYTEITGFGRQEALGRSIFGIDDAIFQVLKEEGRWNGELLKRKKSGEEYTEMLSISAVRDAAGRTLNYVGLFSDITLMKAHQKELERTAHYDNLTGLPNRVLLAEILQQAIHESRKRDRSLIVAYLDLDGFKVVNDNHGHDVGDMLLISVAKRMKSALREGDSLARIGGDEFVAVLLGIEAPWDSQPVLERLLHAASDPVAVNETVLQVSASIGVTIYPQDGVDPDQLIRHADQAMYQAKQAGKNRYHLFDIAHDRAVKSHRESLEHIRRALADGEFELYYQPKVNMKSGAFVGAEALIRWNHQSRGVLLPQDFMPVIANNSLGLEVGEWVIDTAFKQISAWRASGLDIPVSVNVAARDLLRKDFVPQLSKLLSHHGDIPPGHIELEILETSALEDLNAVSAILRACQEIGVQFALDDFGTGYSSLTYLKHLPARMLKIDRSFVRDMLVDQDDLAIVEGIIGLASAFRRHVIAEGVETEEHGRLLVSIGCELGQGYWIAPPMRAESLKKWLADRGSCSRTPS